MTLYFDDCDALGAAAKGWNFEFTQLDRGPFLGSVEQATGQEIAATHFVFNRSFRQRGEVPRSARTFAVFLDRSTPFFWLSSEFQADDLCLFPADGAFDCVSQAGFDACSITISDGLLETVAELHGLQGALAAIPTFGAGFGTDPRSTGLLRQALHQFLASEDSASIHLLEHQLARLVLQCFDSSPLRQPLPCHRQRDRAYFEAMDLIHNGEGSCRNVLELCQSVGVGERTLRNAFQERLGLAPKEYLNAVALQKVRRALKQEDETGVLNIAARFGFLHSGQFARDYRSTFGELPSATQARSGVTPSSL